MSCISTKKFYALGAAALVCFTQLAFAEDSGVEPSPKSASRQWSDVSGRFHAEATLLDTNQSTVRLRKTTGSVIVVPLDRLCLADRQFVAASHSNVQPSETHDTYKPIVSEAIAAARTGSLLTQLVPKVPENMIYVRLSKPFLQRIVARAVSDAAAMSTITSSARR